MKGRLEPWMVKNSASRSQPNIFLQLHTSPHGDRSYNGSRFGHRPRGFWMIGGMDGMKVAWYHPTDKLPIVRDKDTCQVLCWLTLLVDLDQKVLDDGVFYHGDAERESILCSLRPTYHKRLEMKATEPIIRPPHTVIKKVFPTLTSFTVSKINSTAIVVD